MNEIMENEGLGTPQKRPVFLTVLCILSFVVIGFSLIFGTITLAMGPDSEEQLTEKKVELLSQANEMSSKGIDWGAQVFKNLAHIAEATNKSHYLANSSNIIILIIGGIGVLWMFKGKKIGFHFYIIYCLLATIQLYFFVDAKYISTAMVITNLVLSAIFIFMYSRNLKWMK